MKLDNIRPVSSIHHDNKRAAIPDSEHQGEEQAVVGNAPTQSEYEVFLHEFQRGRDPELYWLGKYRNDDEDNPERLPQLRTDIRSLYKHEDVRPEAIIDNLYMLHEHREEGNFQLDLFGDNDFFDDEEEDELERLAGYYRHSDNWQNRLIQGDSLLVMNSLLNREGMKGQVQCVYMDPPYGIRYGGNWQIMINKPKMAHESRDTELSNEPEMIKAYRDTWELGIHSYLSYLRDRLVVARELLTESGSCFVQISDENVHLVRSVMDEVFGSENYVNQLIYQKTTGAGSPNELKAPASVCDYILWYAKDKANLKFRGLFVKKVFGGEGSSAYKKIELEDGTKTERHSSDDEPFSALAFKVMTDPFVGRLTFLRVYSGKITSGSYVLNATNGKKERIARLVRMYADQRLEESEVYAGDICAAVGLKDTTTGDTLCDEKAPIILEKMTFPEPVISVAIEPKTKADQDKMGIALQKLAEEDPSFRVKSDTETGQTIISGMGELHLDIIVDRMLREFKVEANIGKPQVAYRETIRGNADQDSKFIRQSGGKGQYGHCKVRISPAEENAGFVFENKIVGGAIPKEYIEPARKGMEEALEGGILAGYPMIDVKVELYDGSYHEVDSSEMAFKIAGSMAIKEGCKKAQPCILEPMMKVEIEIPDEFTGTIIGDISRRRGRIEGQEPQGNTGNVIVRAIVPLANMFGYATDLRSNTQGRGTFSMEFQCYEQVPANVEKEIIEKAGASKA